MEKKSDSHYPVTKSDTVRICAWFSEKWQKAPGAKKATVTRRECNRQFEVWDRQANEDPWALCWAHAFDDPEERRRKH